MERINAFDSKNEQDVYFSGLLSSKKIIRRRNLNTKNSTEDSLRKKSFDCIIELQGGGGGDKNLQNSVLHGLT